MKCIQKNFDNIKQKMSKDELNTSIKLLEQNDSQGITVIIISNYIYNQITLD